LRSLALSLAAVAVTGAALPGPELDPARLSLPAQGLAVNRPGGVVLHELHGRVVGHLSGFRLVELYGRRPRRAVVVAKGRRTFALGPRGVRPIGRPRPDWPTTARGCHPAPLPYVICGGPYSPRRDASVVYLHGRKLVGPVGKYGGAPTFVGHWRSVERSPDGRTLLLQWSAECETPVAYFADADGSHLRTVAGNPAVESGAVGWARDGRAVIGYPQGVCGRARTPSGTYLVDPRTRRATLVLRGIGALWG
jgi:hypothetical protein